MKCRRLRMMSLLLAICILLMLVACGQTTEEEDKNVNLNIALSNEPATLDGTTTTDTMSHNVIAQMMETLLNVSETYQLEPGLAERWEQVDDLTYRFYLRKGVMFQNGEEMNASDAVFSLKRYAESKIMSNKAGSIDTEAFVIEDDYTFTMQLK